MQRFREKRVSAFQHKFFYFFLLPCLVSREDTVGNVAFRHFRANCWRRPYVLIPGHTKRTVFLWPTDIMQMFIFCSTTHGGKTQSGSSIGLTGAEKNFWRGWCESLCLAASLPLILIRTRNMRGSFFSWQMGPSPPGMGLALRLAKDPQGSSLSCENEEWEKKISENICSAFTSCMRGLGYGGGEQRKVCVSISWLLWLLSYYHNIIIILSPHLIISYYYDNSTLLYIIYLIV